MEDRSVDLLISQYAGIISQPCKRYLKPGGYLLVNNSHGGRGVLPRSMKTMPLPAFFTAGRARMGLPIAGFRTTSSPKNTWPTCARTFWKTEKAWATSKTAALYLFTLR